MADSLRPDQSSTVDAQKSAGQKVINNLQKAVVDNAQEKLHERRKALATKRTAESEETVEVVEFLLGDSAFAFELEQLTEVCQLTGVTWIPGAPEFVLGVINLRGQILPVIDLKTFLGIEQGGVRVFNKALIFRKGKLVVGFIADEVIGARKVPLSQLQHDVTTFCGAGSEYFRAVATDRLILLDGRKIMSDRRLVPSAKTEEQ